MTVMELIERLREFEGDTEVRLAFQPSWPFEHAIGEIAEFDPADEYEIFGTPEVGEDGQHLYEVKDQERDVVFDGSEEECTEWKNRQVDETERVVYIGEAQQLGYLPGAAKAALGW